MGNPVEGSQESMVWTVCIPGCLPGRGGGHGGHGGGQDRNPSILTEILKKQKFHHGFDVELFGSFWHPVEGNFFALQIFELCFNWSVFSEIFRGIKGAFHTETQ